MKCHKSMNSSKRCKSIHRHSHINCIRIFHFMLYTATQTVLIQHITMAPVIMISSMSAAVVLYLFTLFFFGKIEINIWFTMEKMAHENSMMFLNYHEILGFQVIIGFSVFYCFICLLLVFFFSTIDIFSMMQGEKPTLSEQQLHRRQKLFTNAFFQVFSCV